MFLSHQFLPKVCVTVLISFCLRNCVPPHILLSQSALQCICMSFFFFLCISWCDCSKLFKFSSIGCFQKVQFGIVSLSCVLIGWRARISNSHFCLLGIFLFYSGTYSQKCRFFLRRMLGLPQSPLRLDSMQASCTIPFFFFLFFFLTAPFFFVWRV